MSISTIQLPTQPVLAGIKHCNRIEQVLAAREAESLGVDDVLMCNLRQGVQCSVSANVFAVFGDRLVTPPCDESGIAGTRRRLVMEELAARCALEVQERELPVVEVMDADAVFLSNAIAGLRRVESIDARTYGENAALQNLQQAYFDELTSCLAS